jgi:biotin carboxyl carrier protein
MSLQISIDEGDLRDVAVTRYANGTATVWIGGREHHAQLRAIGGGYTITLDEYTEPVYLVVDRDNVFIHAFGKSWHTEVSDPAEKSAAGADQADLASAPMPGTVISISVAAGDAVTTGQPLVVIESMKMQSEIVAWRDGVVERIHVQVGDTFDRGAGLIGLEPEDGAESDAEEAA